MTWHLLQVSDSLDEEFGSALAEIVPLIGWEPDRKWLSVRNSYSTGTTRVLRDPPLSVHSFPVVRGYARFPWKWIARTGENIASHLLRSTDDPASSTLICTTPFVATVAERWPGPVVYWLTDLIAKYDGMREANIRELDARMCRVAALAFPNSSRIATYLTEQAGCPEGKIHVLPNATRASNLLNAPSKKAGPLPPDAGDLEGPIAGVIGNLAGNMDWLFLEELVGRVPAFRWCFVGPTTMEIADHQHRAARERLLQSERCRFVGRKRYGDLGNYARGFDVAVLPYRRCEPTYSGSSTRFYEHLAAGRPMIATKGFEELLRKPPLLYLADDAAHAAILMTDLYAVAFNDGFEELRWRESHHGTWQARAFAMTTALKSALASEMRRNEATSKSLSALWPKAVSNVITQPRLKSGGREQ